MKTILLSFLISLCIPETIQRALFLWLAHNYRKNKNMGVLFLDQNKKKPGKLLKNVLKMSKYNPPKHQLSLPQKYE